MSKVSLSPSHSLFWYIYRLPPRDILFLPFAQILNKQNWNKKSWKEARPTIINMDCGSLRLKSKKWPSWVGLRFALRVLYVAVLTSGHFGSKYNTFCLFPLIHRPHVKTTTAVKTWLREELGSDIAIDNFTPNGDFLSITTTVGKLSMIPFLLPFLNEHCLVTIPCNDGCLLSLSSLLLSMFVLGHCGGDSNTTTTKNPQVMPRSYWDVNIGYSNIKKTVLTRSLESKENTLSHSK